MRPFIPTLAATLLAGILLASPLSLRAQNTDPDDARPGDTFNGDAQNVDAEIIERIKRQPLNWHFGASLMVSNPQDSLRRALQRLGSPDVGYGFGVDLGYHFDPVPVAVIGEFAMHFYGGQSHEKIQRGPFFNDTLSYETLNLQMPVTFSARVQPSLFSWVHPYVEGIGGFMVFNSSLTVDRRTGAGEQSESQNETSASWVYGVGAGLMVKTNDIITLPSSLSRVLVDVRFRYLRSTDVEIPTIKLRNDGSYFVESASIPDPAFVLFNIGVAVQF